MGTQKLILLISLASIIPGQLFRLPIGSSGAFTLTDITTAVLIISFLLYFFFTKKPIYLIKNVFSYFLVFTILAVISTVLALNTFTLQEVILGSLFLVRFILYFTVALVTLNTIRKEEIANWLNAVLAIGTIFSVFGILQLLIFPDLRQLANYGWDPHVNRLVSSLIDPNFTGGLITIFFIISLVRYLFTKRSIYLIISALFVFSLIATFSRSSYLSLIGAIVTLGIIKSPRLLFAILIIFLILIIGIPKSRSRVIGGLTLDETSKSRIESWQNAYSIFSKNYLFGVGFNTFRYAQIEAGTFSIENPQGGHSGSGVDSSILLVAVTTGIVGFFSFIIFLFSIFASVIKNSKTNYLKLITITSLISLLVHSQFVNSMFFPQIAMLFWFLLGLNYARGSKLTDT